MTGRGITDERLAALQDALSDLFYAQLAPAEVARRLATDPAFAEHRAWVASFDDRLVEAQNATVRAWAERRPGR
ncbi:MAG TPA: hypothetical protein VHW23_36985 [Kofleriaceae bacterium]|nr:hypothetical protein [Kofleriaceae bacterium]